MYRIQVRQGDILISQAIHGIGRNETTGAWLTTLPTPKRPLAEGEATGHMHEVAEGEYELYEDSTGTLWMRVLSRHVTVTHPEHATVTVPTGNYRIIQQREQGENEPCRRVAD